MTGSDYATFDYGTVYFETTDWADGEIVGDTDRCGSMDMGETCLYCRVTGFTPTDGTPQVVNSVWYTDGMPHQYMDSSTWCKEEISEFSYVRAILYGQSD